MQNSLPVYSNQSGRHVDLSTVLQRHLNTPFQRPLPDWVRNAAQATVHQAAGRPLILDSGCGTGLSSLLLAQRHPDAFVVGLDQSSHRLARFQPEPATAGVQPANAVRGDSRQVLQSAGRNLLLVRADAQDYWRALVQIGATLSSHYLLYPNPWPKAHHLKRRWHGHPVWPYLLQLGGRLELRTNWSIYADEFAYALANCCICPVEMDRLSNSEALAQPMSLFEKKYAVSGHTLWRVAARLPGSLRESGT